MPLRVLIMTNTIRELMCLVIVSQRNCRRGWNNTDQQRRSHEGNFSALSSPAYGNSKRQEPDSQRVSRKLFPDTAVGQSELQTVPIIQQSDEAQELTISDKITCQSKYTLESKARAVRSNALEDQFRTTLLERL